jgi:hypothetical protein
MTHETNHHQPSSRINCRGGEDDESRRHDNFDGDHPHATIGYRETDIDRGDYHERQRSYEIRLQPPEPEGRSSLKNPCRDPGQDRDT